MKNFLNPWVIAGTILVASALFILSFLAAGWLTAPSHSAYQGGGAITIIPVPTATRTPLPTRTAVPAVTPVQEDGSGIQVGASVQIAGTGGDGLRLRSDPSLSGEIVYLGLEGEIFTVRGGPQQGDGYVWWQLEAPLNPSRQGWAVANFLELAQNQ